jgi:hypothetical protein
MKIYALMVLISVIVAVSHIDFKRWGKKGADARGGGRSALA